MQISEISDIFFTKREIDVLSCLLHNRGEKKIAQILSISPRTVETHVNNIKMKLSGCSREQIIDFLESSGKIEYLRKWYGDLLIYNIYLDTLSKIGYIQNPIQQSYCFIVEIQNNKNQQLFKKIKIDLVKAGIKIVEDSKDAINIYINDKKFEEEKDSCPVLDIYKEQDNKEHIVSFTSSSKYIDNIFLLLRALSKQKKVFQIIDDFNKKSCSIQDGFCKRDFSYPKFINSGKKIKKNYILVLVILLCVMIGMILAYKAINVQPKSPPSAISNTLVPQLKVNYYLERPAIIKKISNKLSKSKGINTIALVGLAGSGKSTLARQYAYNNKTSIVWEINAENDDNIVSSLECLAYAMCSTSQEKTDFYKIQKITNSFKREKMFRIFLLQKAKQNPGWIIIFDNVKRIENLQRYLPYDVATSGNGNIVITTTNSNIINSSYIEDNNVIYIPKLEPQEAFNLFTKIIPVSDSDSESLKQFLKELPPFPLDITQAAYYIKNTNMSRDQYLAYLKSNNKTFNDSQESLMKTISNYTKTRNKIIQLSIKHIIEIDKEFRDLLLLISLLNSENIPKKLLVAYKGEIITNNFLREMSKFSFITSNSMEEKDEIESLKFFSVQQSIQSIALKYLTQSQSTKITYKQFAPIIENFMDNQLCKGDYPKLKIVVDHIEKLLINQHLFTEEFTFALNTTLSIYYYLINDNIIKAKDFLVYSRGINSTNFDHQLLIKNAITLGIMYRHLGNYQQSENYLKQAVTLSSKSTNLYKSSALTALAITYNFLGNYKKAENLFLDAIKINSQLFDSDSIKNAWNLSNLAANYISQAKYENANAILTDLLINFSDESHLQFTRFAWIKTFIGKLNIHQGNYKVAEQNLDEALEVFKNIYGNNSNGLATTLLYLGEMQTDLKNYEIAKKYLDLAEKIIVKINNESMSNLVLAQINRYQGKLNLDVKNYTEANRFLHLSYNFFVAQHPVSSYERALTKLYLEEIKRQQGKAHKISEILPILREHYGNDHIKLKDFVDL